jgi:hypothetical protein
MCEMNAVESATGGAIRKALEAGRPRAWAAAASASVATTAVAAATPARRNLLRRLSAITR